jgi:pimeloyl-ACP methyl ester carboxylesterase
VYVLGFIICAPFGEVYQKGVSEKVRLPQASPHAFTRLFATFFNIDEPTRHMMQDHIEVNEGVRMADFEPPSVGPGINLPVLIAHDSADSVNSLIDGQAFHKVIAGAQLYQTNGLGHRKILKDKLTIEEITRFILRD